jgi:serine/threonine protein kinase
MIALPGIAIQDTLYESTHSLVYRGMRDDGLAVIVKRLKEEYPSPQVLTRYRQEYAITRSLNLEGVVKAYSQQDYQRTLVILLEDFGGESLEHWMRQRSNFCPMPLATFLQLAIDLADIWATFMLPISFTKILTLEILSSIRLQAWSKSLTSALLPNLTARIPRLKVRIV